MDDIACLQSRIEYYGNERKKKINEHLAIQNGDYSNHYGDYNNHYGYSSDQSGYYSDQYGYSSNQYGDYSNQYGDYSNHYDHQLIKRAIDSFDDCFDFIDEPLYGFRVNISMEFPCPGEGANCDIQNLLRRSDTQFQVRQTGENFRSDAPPDCRLSQCSSK